MGSNLFDIIDTVFTLEGAALPGIPQNLYMENTKKPMLPEIKDVIFNDPATIVFWEDGTKTIVKCQRGTGDIYSKETGLAMAIVKKAYGNRGNFNDILSRWLNK